MRNQIKELLTPAWLRSFLAIAMVLLTVSFMNNAVFPLFDTVSVYSREVATTANVLAFIAIGLVAFLKPARLNSTALNATAFVCLLAAALLLPCALTFDNTGLMHLGATVVGIARAWVMMSAALAASTLNRAQLGTCIAAAFLVFYPCDIVALSCPVIVSVTLFLGLPLVSLALSSLDADPVLKAASSAEPPLDLAVTQPNTFLPLGNQIFVCLFLFRVAYGFALRFGEEAGTPLISTWAILVVACVAIYMLLARKSLPIDTTVSWSVLLVIVGFYAIATGNAIAPQLGVTLLSAGSTLFDMVSWMILIAIMARNVYGATAVFAWGHGLMGIGTILGAQIAVRNNEALLANESSLLALCGFFIVLFAAYALFILRDCSFAKMIAEITPASPGESAAADVTEVPAVEQATAIDGNAETAADSEQPEAAAPTVEAAEPQAPAPLTIEERCARIAERGKLTKREAEILGMLARGRNRAYIEETLVVSRNTVNSHVKHIYAKLDIHSHQELLDIVEAEE